MATHQTRGQMTIHQENMGIPRKMPVASDKAKITQTATKKGLVSRKALNDITNRSSIRQEVSSTKKSLQKEGINTADEGFLHDHKKCIEAKKRVFEPSFILDTILPGHDTVFPAELTKTGKPKSDPDSPRSFSELDEQFSDWMKASVSRDSPPASPISWDSPPSSPFAWQFKPVEFVLKPDTDGCF